MDAQLKARWVAALRSGDYLQGRTKLHNKCNNTYCCLGVLATIAGVNQQEIATHCMLRSIGQLKLLGADLPPHLQARRETQLTTLNDDDRLSFAEIANWIEANMPAEETA